MKIVQWVMDNFDTALAIVISAIAAIFGIFGVFQSALLPALAGTLALLAVSVIRDRVGRDLLTREVQKLEKTIGLVESRPSADVFFKTRTSETNFISVAHEEIWLVQETGSKVIEENLKSLVSLIKRGGSLKLILASNDSQIVSYIAFRNRTLDVKAFNSRQDDAKVKIHALRNATQGASGYIEIRYIDYPLDITGVFVDPESENTIHRKGLIRMVGFHNFFDDKRDFAITYSTEPETYQYFVEQFKEMWKLSREQDNS